MRSKFSWLLSNNSIHYTEFITLRVNAQILYTGYTRFSEQSFVLLGHTLCALYRYLGFASQVRCRFVNQYFFADL